MEKKELIESKYKELKTLYELPEFLELEEYFVLTEINKERVLIDIRKKMFEVIEYYSGFLENVFQPEGDFAVFLESNSFDAVDKKNAMSIYKKFMYYIREGQIVAVMNNDKLTADYINTVFKLWKDNRESLVYLIKKSRDSWNGLEDKEDEHEYFG